MSSRTTKLEPEWVALEEAEHDDNIVSFDCQAHAKFCRDLDVVSFPSIRLYHRDGRMDRYRGERKAREIAMFVHRALRPYFMEADEHTIGPTTLLDDVVIMAHPHPDDWNFYDQFRTLAQRHRDRVSFIVSPPIGDSSALVCYNNVDDVKHTASDLVTVGALEKFLKLCAEPLIPELTRRNEAHYATTGKSLLHYFATTDAEKEAYREEMRPLAKKYAEFLHFTITDASEYPEMLATVGLKAGQKTGMALENTNTGDMFPFTGQRRITAAVVEAFLEEITSGGLRPWNRGAEDGRQGRGHDEL
ncbi:protein disulfide-isomerase [Chaetomidium leptoderma]|uniref:Protein disulfide-isomerase n=1 Tax=Chaetomidium leptoderma TaxID=669021 RepID=A0AAN6VCG6_9PEZI|nr:protein disulfide-isomerase [Chaetomidium leptoderma]